jgi:DNA-binding transcriptional regulator YhcF (GntR family)
MVKRPDISLSYISYTLGHQTTQTLQKHYSHLRQDDIVKIFERSENNRQKFIEDRKKEINDKKNELLSSIDDNNSHKIKDLLIEILNLVDLGKE